MAYSIRSQGKTFTEGTYVMGRFKLAPSQAREVETNLRLTEDILRFLMVKADTPLKPPAPKAEAAAQQTASEAMPATEPAPETVPPQPAVEGESTPG
jgi:ribosomal protein S6